MLFLSICVSSLTTDSFMMEQIYFKYFQVLAMYLFSTVQFFHKIGCWSLFKLRDENSITMPRLEGFWLCTEAKKSFIMPLYQEYTKWGEVGVSVYSLDISVQQRNWCHTKATTRILRGNWHFIVTEDASNKWWSHKVHIMILEHT